jgi:FAD-dependent urate hydroxylase
MRRYEVVIIGAGPYGLSAAAHLRRQGADVKIFGDPMSFWRTMPRGMVLRSNWTATSIAEYDGELSLDSYCEASGHRFGLPVPLERFVDYGTWVQERVAPDTDRRTVTSVAPRDGGFEIEVEDDRMWARRVVVACGIRPFAWKPAAFGDLPAELASHTGDHTDFSVFTGRRVQVVGGGQSALESAALLHEAGAEVEVAVRAPLIHWLHGGKYHRMLGRYSKLVYAPTDVGPMGLSRLVAVPDVFRRLPWGAQRPLAHRAIRPAGAAWLRPRLADVPVRLGTQVRTAEPTNHRLAVELSDGTRSVVDHLLFGTGYRVDIALYPFLSSETLEAIERIDGYPRLRSGLESSIPGLHFVGATAARSFGPIMRFVSGSWYASAALVRSITGRSTSEEAPQDIAAKVVPLSTSRRAG